MLYLLLRNSFCQHSHNCPQVTCQKKSPRHTLGWIYRMPLIASLSGAYPQCVSGGSWVATRSLPPSCFPPAAAVSSPGGPTYRGIWGRTLFLFPSNRIFFLFLVWVRLIWNLATQDLSHIVKLVQKYSHHLCWAVLGPNIGDTQGTKLEVSSNLRCELILMGWGLWIW